MKIKSAIIILFILSICLVTFGYIMDDDIQNPSLVINIEEFMMMTFLIFAITFIIYFGIAFSFKKAKIMFS